MFKNYLTIAWRNLLRNKVYTIVTISGLAIGLAVCMQIVLYVGHEYSYDKFHKNVNQLYVADTQVKIGDNKIYTNMRNSDRDKLMAHASIVSSVRYKLETDGVIIENKENPSLKFQENRFMFADGNFFDLFSFKIIRGDEGQVLRAPFNLVVSEKMAQKYFGKENPIGKTLVYNNLYDFVVTGISEDPPSNSSISYDFAASISSMAKMQDQQVFVQEEDRSFTTCVQLGHMAVPNQVASDLLKDLNKGEKDDLIASYGLKPFNRVHLDSNSFNLRYIKVFPFIAILILLLALINYASLSTARSATRSKEIGVRKVLGANRKSVATQFFFESALYTTIAFALGFLLCIIFQPYFFDFLQIPIDDSFLYSPKMLTSFLALFVVTVLLAATYPAILLSAYRPIMALYGKVRNQEGGISVRKFFIIFQFTISVVLIICGIAIDRQMDFFRHVETGVDRENVVMVPFSPEAGKHFAPFEETVRTLPEVSNISTANLQLYSGHNIMTFNRLNSDEMVFLPYLSVDQNFVSLLGLEWKIPPTDSLYGNGQNEIALLNESAIEKLNLEADPTHQKINDQYEIKGVLKDFAYMSLHHKIDAFCLLVNPKENTAPWKYGGTLFAKINPNVNLPTFINRLKKVYEEYDHQKPFEYHFLNDAFDAQYKAEDRLAKIFGVFTAFAILIAAMGLFGLITFMAVQRKKEIGIRKVLGASVQSVISLLSKDLFILIVTAIVIASPLAYWFVQNWLENFAYRISISWWMFALAGAGALFIAMLTVSFQALKAARSNPVKALRSE